ncbi:hypothetical protein COV93_02110, partial [Candidatus Woesearchaeota archaeon CG11_big_fil_rev_8_21_14_0_20_43_8]
AIIALISLSQGLENAITENFESLGVSNIRVTPGHLRGPPTAGNGLDGGMLDIVRKIKGVKYANPVLLNQGKVTYNNEEKYMLITAEDPATSIKGVADAKIDLTEGRYMLPADNNVVIMGYTIAYDLFEKDVSARTSIDIDGRKFKVIGIFEKTGTSVDSTMIMPIDTARDLFDVPDKISVIVVNVESGEDKEAMGKKIRRVLERHYDKDAFDIFTPEQLLAQLQTILGIVEAVLVGIAAISLVVGAVGIMNSMFTSVMERTREIGIFKAIGASNSSILTMFLIESGSMGLFGGAAGVIMGLFFAKAVEKIADLAGFGLISVKVSIPLVLFALGFAFVIGMISGVLPAYKASKLKPVDALRYE